MKRKHKLSFNNSTFVNVREVAKEARALGAPITQRQAVCGERAAQAMGLEVVYSRPFARGLARLVRRSDAKAYLDKLREQQEENNAKQQELALQETEELAEEELAHPGGMEVSADAVVEVSKELQYRTLIDIRDTMYDIRSLLKQMLDEWRS